MAIRLLSKSGGAPKKKGNDDKRSLNAKLVAKDVIEHVANGRKVNMKKILKGRGYSDAVATHPQRVVETLSYKETIDPVVAKLIAHRDEVIKMLKKKLPKAKYRDLTDSIDKLTKNIQLLSGKPTDRPAETLEVDEEQIGRMMEQINKRRTK